MSVRLMSLVWALPTDSPAEKLVLLKLADCANDDGDSIYPKRRTVAAQTELSEKTVATVISKYVARGVLAVTEQGGGRGNQARYCINVEVLRAAVAQKKHGSEFQVSEPQKGEANSRKPVLNQEVSSMFTDEKVEVGSTKRGSEFHVCEAPLLIGDLTIKDPSEGGAPALVEELVAILRTVPGFARASGPWPEALPAFLAEHPTMRETDWVSFVRYVTDAVSEQPSMKQNSCSSFSPVASMRERLVKWQRSVGWVAKSDCGPPLEVKIADEHSAKPALVVDCAAWYPTVQKWIPSNRESELAKGRKVRDLDGAPPDTIENDLGIGDGRRRGMAKAAGGSE